MFSDEWVPKNENEKNSKKTLLKKCLLILSFYSFCRVKWKEEASSNYYYIKINSLIIINCYLKNNFFIFFFCSWPVVIEKSRVVKIGRNFLLYDEL